jgi:radical SAM-linked protein
LPWDHFDIGLEQGFLAREYQKALKNRLSPPCGKAAGMFIHHTNVADASSDQRRLVCYDCGVACDMSRMREERITFLRDMGAIEPPQLRRTLPLAAGGAGPGPMKVRRPEEERPRQPGVKHARWRLTFEKLGPSALLGHLDFIREIGRVIRRAGLRPVYSQGFNPKPRFTFGPALALGVASLDEKIDVDLIDPPAASVIIERLNAASSRGLTFTAAEELGTTSASLGEAVIGARYIIVFAEAMRLTRNDLEVKIAEFLQRDKTIVKRTVKGIGRLIDVKARIKSIALGGDEAHGLIARAGIGGRLTCVVADVDVGPEGSLRPNEIVEALLGDGEVPHQVLRAELLLAAATTLKPRSSKSSISRGDRRDASAPEVTSAAAATRSESATLERPNLERGVGKEKTATAAAGQ